MKGAVALVKRCGVTCSFVIEAKGGGGRKALGMCVCVCVCGWV